MEDDMPIVYKDKVFLEVVVTHCKIHSGIYFIKIYTKHIYGTYQGNIIDDYILRFYNMFL